ncbi:MAG TPA: hypothetical protein DDW30_04120 [Clostridiales bacterium]|nr:hypothetical protein [Clostridiales bacterium]
MEFPYLSGAGLYRSEISEYRNLKQSPMRTVTEYEIELFCDDYRYGIVDDVRVPYRRGTVLIAKPGSRRCSRFHFSCYYLHLTVTDPELRAALDALPVCLTVTDEDAYIALFRRISALFPEADDRAPLEMTGLLLLLLARLTGEKDLRGERALPQVRQDVIATARTVINERYAEDLSLHTLAEEVHLNPTYFHRVFRAACGMTPLAYLTEVRISHAKFLLRNTDRSVTEIAGQCGFSSYNYFCTVFRKATGLSPSTFRNRANRVYDGER